MGKSSAHSKHKDKQRKDAQGDPIMLSKQRWSDWSNFVLGAAAMTSTILYVWRKIQANQINRAGQAPGQMGARKLSLTPRPLALHDP